MKKDFVRGMSHGVPIMLGYLSVSFGFGILAVSKGLSALWATVISLTNVTSAGQAKGVEMIAAGSTLLEMALVQITINIRYSLMALSLSQKLDKRFTTPHRLAASYSITDEIFAVCSAQEKPLTPAYMYGMIFVAVLGWVSGTAMGAAAGELLPAAVSNAMGIVLYGMFIAIVIPPCKKERGVLAVSLTAVVLSLLFRYLFTSVSGGFAMIICAVAASLAGAWFFPVKETEEGGKE
ncbi:MULTISPECIES: AzlC family ABC transporter permease [Ruminococcus]|uniref:AzlC family protein n=1 Tax=Ruminococcus albus (strain ATCC 27210 / DSM 20455 / JCM 14654 / NCDO 2250 / 7) TaxID=697329 RepID=E6UEA2_RUMA7|nr:MULTISPECIES: AzlC family ABC transporter permease [Ruminococcus]ADU23492.1 AzlC family protein [Ruminococcus albus 7 = DSM 20455]MCR5020982.1 AzlC family ABC transporter permease [Ruminococcus sp.]